MAASSVHLCDCGKCAEEPVDIAALQADKLSGVNSVMGFVWPEAGVHDPDFPPGKVFDVNGKPVCSTLVNIMVGDRGRSSPLAAGADLCRFDDGKIYAGKYELEYYLENLGLGRSMADSLFAVILPRSRFLQSRNGNFDPYNLWPKSFGIFATKTPSQPLYSVSPKWNDVVVLDPADFPSLIPSSNLDNRSKAEIIHERHDQVPCQLVILNSHQLHGLKAIYGFGDAFTVFGVLQPNGIFKFKFLGAPDKVTRCQNIKFHIPCPGSFFCQSIYQGRVWANGLMEKVPIEMSELPQLPLLSVDVYFPPDFTSDESCELAFIVNRELSPISSCDFEAKRRRIF